MAPPLSPNPPRKGRPPNFVINDDGAPIFGLSAQAIRKGGEIVSHRYYATFSKPRVWFGFDRRLAIMQFRSWEAEQKDEAIRVSYPKRPSPAQRQRAEKWAKKLDGKVVRLGSWDFSKIPAEIMDRLVLIPENPGKPDMKFSLRVNTGDLAHTSIIPSKQFWLRIRDLILANPKLAAEKTGIKELAYLADLRPPPASIKLTEIGEQFLRKRFGDRDEKRRAEKAWGEFCEIVRTPRIKELDQDDIDRYHRVMTDGRYSKKTIKHRFDRIGSILDHAYKRRKEHRPELAELKTDFRAICSIRVSKKGKPRPIHVDDYHALYRAAGSSKLRAICLTMMNFAMHPSEATSLTKDDIDLRQGHLWTNRKKTGEVERVGVAWKETISATRKYQREQKSNPIYQESELMFLTNSEKPYARGGLGSYFRETWKPRAEKLAKRKLRFTLDSLRDGAQNAADENDCDPIHTAMLMGHVLPGVADAYKTRRPKKTKRSVQAIHDRYRIKQLTGKSERSGSVKKKPV